MNYWFVKAMDIQKNNRKEELGNERVGRLLFKYSGPAIVGVTASSLYNIVDTIFIGQGAGPLALSGLAVSFPVFLILIGISISTGVGASSVISRALGANDDERALRATGNAMLLIALFSLAIMILGTWFLDPVLRLFGASDSVLPYAHDYMSVISLGSFFICFSNTGSNFARAEGNAKVSMASMLIGTIINLILDPIFIFGLGWGIKGAAIATVIATAAASGFLLFYFFLSGRSLLHIQRSHLVIDGEISIETTKIGFSTLSRFLMASLQGIFINNSIVYYGGDLYLAILVIVYRLYIFVTFPIYGIGMGLQPIIGFNYGAGKLQRVKESLRKAIASSVVLTSLAFLVMMIFAEQLLRLFSGNEMIIDKGQEIMRIMIIMLPLAGFYMTGFVLFQAIGKPLPALLVSLSPQLSFLPLVLLLPMVFKLWGVWIAFPASNFFGFAFSLFLIGREVKKLGNYQEQPEIQTAEA